MEQTLLNKKILVIQDSHWKYEGNVEDETEDLLWVLDDKTQRSIMIRKDTITRLEVLSQ